MKRRVTVLLSGALLLAAAAGTALAGEDPAFTTEAFATLSYTASDTDRVEVVVGGVPAPGYSLTGTASGPGMTVGATWYACGVADDGVSPRALLPLLSRRSFAGASAGLTSERRDSEGTATGQLVRITSTSTGDGSLLDVSAGGGWYAGRSTALLLGAGYGRGRRTDATQLLESPSGKSQIGRLARRESAARVTAGALRWLGDDLLVTAEGEWARTDASRTDDLLASTGSGAFSQETETLEEGWGARLGGRALLLDRRLVVDLSGRYAESREDGRLVAPESRPYSDTRLFSRELSLGAVWYATRDLGLGLSAGYGTESLATGLDSLRRAGSVRRFPVAVTASWFASERAALTLSVGETLTRATYPPEGPTYERYEGWRTRVELSGSLRF